MLHLEHPLVLFWLFGVILFVGILVYLKRKFPGSTTGPRILRLALGFSSCLFALSRPQVGHQTTESHGTRTNLFLAIDISRSMTAEDIPPSRLKFSIAFAQKLLESLGNVRVALYPFAEDGFLLMPLSNDLLAASELLSTLDPAMTTSQSTDFSISLKTLFERIQSTAQAAERTPAGWAPPQVLLFSDGETHEPPASRVLSLYKKEHIPVHVVGVGTRAGTRLHLPTSFDGFTSFGEGAGQVVTTKLEPKNLQALAEGTSGTFFSPSISEVGRVAQRLTQAFQFGRLSVKFKADQELYPFFFAAAFLLFALEFCLGRWQYAIRMGLLFALLVGAPVRAEDDDSLEGFGLSVTETQPKDETEPLRGLDDRRRSVELYNLGMKHLGNGDIQKAADRFQEAAQVAPEKQNRKKALFNLGNMFLRMMDPSQALQAYQEAFDTQTESAEFDKTTNQKISDNIALASRLESQMAKSRKGRDDQESDDGKGKDRGGPKKDYEPQSLSEAEKKKLFDVINAEEQETLKRLMERKNRGKNRNRVSGKQW